MAAVQSEPWLWALISNNNNNNNKNNTTLERFNPNTSLSQHIKCIRAHICAHLLDVADKCAQTFDVLVFGLNLLEVCVG
jgi:hypothetical protein